MKKNIALLIIGLVCCFLPGTASAQAQITTRKEKLKDLTTKVTKVVIPGDDILKEALKESVSDCWTISPYEYCTMAEFESLKTNPSFYFLVVTQSSIKDEEDPGISMLSFVKGGPEAQKGIDKMLEVTSFPLCSAGSPSGREFVLLPAILTVMQDLSSSMTDTEFKAYSNLYKYNKNMAKLKTKTIHLCEDDIAPQVNKKVLSSLDEDILIEDEDTVCDVFNDATFNGVVSYVVAPEEPVKGSACYKMLIGADDNKLYFFKKHKISEHKGVGFLEGDLKEINRVR